MIFLPIKEEFDKIMLSVSSVVDKLEERRYTFIEEVGVFIGIIEKKAEKYKLPFAADAGILRGKLYVIDELCDFPRQGGYNPETRKMQRRNRDAFALQRLSEACQLVRTHFISSEQIFLEAQRLCRQVAAVAQSKRLLVSLLSNVDNIDTEHDVRLRILWDALHNDSDLCSLCTHVSGLVGIHNALILFDRALGEIGVQ